MSSVNYLQHVKYVPSCNVPWPMFVEVIHTVNSMTGRGTVIAGKLLS